MTKLCPFIKAVAVPPPSTPYYNVKTDFGANNLTGDGVTNDATKLNAIIAASTSGDTLYFPVGTYLCSSVIVCKDGVHLWGVDDTSWVKGKIWPASNCHLTNLKVGDDSSTGFGRIGGGAPGFYPGYVVCTNVFFIGAVIFQASLGYPGGLHDSSFNDCTFLKGTHGGNLITFYVNGDVAGATTRDVTFTGCTWEGSDRMNIEITCYGAASNNFLYPWTGINFYDCDFGPTGGQNLSLCGRRAGYWDVPYSGGYACGYGTMSGCYIEDAGVAPPSGTNAMGIEAMMLHSYKFDNNVFGRNRLGSVTGSHMAAMIETGVDDLEHKSNAGYNNEMYNIITGNIFDGSASATSRVIIKGDHNDFSGNTVIGRLDSYITNAQNCAFSGNDFRTVDANGNLSTTGKVLWISDARTITFLGDTFRSKASETILLSVDYTAPTGIAQGIAFTDCIWVKDAGDTPVTAENGSSHTNTNPTYQVA